MGANLLGRMDAKNRKQAAQSAVKYTKIRSRAGFKNSLIRDVSKAIKKRAGTLG